MDENEKMIRLATEIKDENKNNLEAVDKESDETPRRHLLIRMRVVLGV